MTQELEENFQKIIEMVKKNQYGNEQYDLMLEISNNWLEYEFVNKENVKLLFLGWYVNNLIEDHTNKINTTEK